jgi:hypothetical protein
MGRASCARISDAFKYLKDFERVAPTYISTATIALTCEGATEKTLAMSHGLLNEPTVAVPDFACYATFNW